jgi:tetratricopeptide (TPR) repeat protein
LDEAERRQLRELAQAVEEFEHSRPNEPSVLRLRALWTMLEKPTTQGRDRVIRLLQKALEREPESMSRKNDLAAAYLLRATMDEQPADLAAALELLDFTALKSSLSTEMLFNRAYTLQCLNLWAEAREIWLRLPGAPPVMSSPRQPPTASGVSMTAKRVDAGPAISLDPLMLRRRGEWLLGEWGARSLGGDAEEAGSLLAEAEEIGGRLSRANGDQLLDTAVAVIRQAQKRGDQLQVSRLAHGHATFHSVRGDAIYSECLSEVLAKAEAQLAAAGSPFAGWVRLDQAVCAYFDKDFPRAEKILSALRLNSGRLGELALTARVDWILGLIRMVQARFVEADRLYSAAIELFLRLGEDAHVVYLHSLRAKSYEYGGAPREAWNERLAALAGRDAVTDPERRFTIFDEAARAMRSQGFFATALEFLAEQMRAAQSAARETGKSDLLAYTLLYRADLLAEIGRRAEAIVAVGNAEEAWSKLAAENESRRRLRLEIDVRHALYGGSTRSQDALAAVDRTISFLAGPSSSLGTQIEILRLYKLRAQVNLQGGSFQAARADLLRGIVEMERQRLGVAGMEDRARFLTQGRALFLDLVRLEVDQFQDPLAALEVFERSSNRVFADTAHAFRSESAGAFYLSDGVLRGALPKETLVIRFGHLADRLLIWTFLGGVMRFEQHPVAEADLIRAVQGCRRLLAQGGSVVEREAACEGLARILIPQRLGEFPLNGRVLLIPDEALASLPLAALRMTPGQPYLVEKFRISYAPSLATLLTPSGARSRHETRLQSALFVSDPAFSQELFPALVRLPAAARSVSDYAAHYPRTAILSDREATVSAVLAVLERFDLLQFDGHGITNTQYPEQGGLLLAPAPAGQAASDLQTSLLTAEDLPARSLSRLRLVVLGACSTGLTAYGETAESTGLAAAILARGVPEVVAAAWDIPDAASALLLDRFHRELATGRATDEALQAAQLALLHAEASAGKPIAAWAAFQVFRGGGENL